MFTWTSRKKRIEDAIVISIIFTMSSPILSLQILTMWTMTISLTQYLFFQLYRFLARRTNSKFNKIIMKRLFMPRVHRPPIALSKVSELANKPTRAGKIITVVGTVTDDNRFYEVPKMTVSGHYLIVVLTRKIRVFCLQNSFYFFSELIIAMYLSLVYIL